MAGDVVGGGGGGRVKGLRRKGREKGRKQKANEKTVYTPPNAAVYGCNVFNEENGRSTHVGRCTVFSEYGARPEDA
jgi:hypothetical protein